MGRVVVVLGSSVLFLFGAAGVASANEAPPPNAHNCAGVFVSELVGPEFGEAVSAAAHAQVVDNFGLANCDQDNRNNP